MLEHGPPLILFNYFYLISLLADTWERFAARDQYTELEVLTIIWWQFNNDNFYLKFFPLLLLLFGGIFVTLSIAFCMYRNLLCCGEMVIDIFTCGVSIGETGSCLKFSLIIFIFLSRIYSCIRSKPKTEMKNQFLDLLFGTADMVHALQNVLFLFINLLRFSFFSCSLTSFTQWDFA